MVWIHYLSQGTKIPHASQCSQKSLKIRKERDKEVKMKKKKKEKHYYFRQDHLSLGEGLGFMMGITSPQFPVGQEIPG